jgi:hypothetical protein
MLDGAKSFMGMFDYPRKKVKLMKILSKKSGRKEEAAPH